MAERKAAIRTRIIIGFLRNSPRTFKEIENKLKIESEIQGYDLNISQRTFQRDMEDILSLYGIEIQYNFAKKAYYIHDEGKPEYNERLFEAFDTFNALNINERISKHIHLEKRKSQGTENLYGLLHAIQNKLQAQFTYQKFDDQALESREIHPYALKEFRNRWYVIGKDISCEEIRIFGLDRMSDINIEKTKFRKDPGFDLNQWFHHCFGIIVPKEEEEPQEIILSFDPHQGMYIKSLPLHHTQEIIRDDDKELRIRLKLYITYDLIMELLSYGERMKVISPESLVEQIKHKIMEASKNYK